MLAMLTPSYFPAVHIVPVDPFCVPMVIHNDVPFVSTFVPVVHICVPATNSNYT